MAPKDSSKEVPKKVALNALNMALGTLSSRVLGLVRDIALAALFSRTITDAWTAAFRLPNLFRRLLGEGSLSVSFIPVFVEARIDSEARARNLANASYTLLLLILGTLTVFGILFAEPLLRLLLDPAFESVPGKFLLTLRMAKIMFGFVFFVSTYAYFMGLLNALGKFALAAVAPVLFNIAMIVSTFLPKEWFPYEGDGLAWGVLVGGVLQAAVLIPALKRLGYMPSLSFSWKNPDVRRVLKNLLPGLLGMGLLQLATIVNLRFASSLGEGAISYIYWADRLLELPLSLVAVSLGSALLPTLSGMWSVGERQRFSETVNYYLRLNLYIAVPAALGLYFLALPIVQVLFQRGQFTNADAEATAAVLRVYSLILISSSCVRVLVPAYYAIKNTWLPAVISTLALVVHIVIAPLLMGSYGLTGLVSSSWVSASLNFVLLLALYPMLMGSFQTGLLLRQVGKFLLAGAVMVGVLQTHPLLLRIFGVHSVGQVISLTVVILLSILSYGLVSHLFAIEEYRSTVHRLLKKRA